LSPKAQITYSRLLQQPTNLRVYALEHTSDYMHHSPWAGAYTVMLGQFSTSLDQAAINRIVAKIKKNEFVQSCSCGESCQFLLVGLHSLWLEKPHHETLTRDIAQAIAEELPA
jgi:hypothetical protein